MNYDKNNYKSFAVLVLRVVLQSATTAKSCSPHQLTNANRQHRHKVRMPVPLAPDVH